MKKIFLISCRDYRSYFASPIAYIFMLGFLLIIGTMFFNNLYSFWQFTMRQNPYGGPPPSITDGILRPLYGNMNVIFLFVIPAITMRLFAEEKKLHTIELILTAPVTLFQIVLGKFFSAFTFVLTILATTLVYPIILFSVGNPDLGAIFTNYLGTLLLVSCYISVGLLYSAMTENQIIAYVLALGTCLFLWIVSWYGQTVSPPWNDLANFLSLVGHYYQTFARGIIKTSDIVYYFSFIGFGLFLTYRVLDSYRWS